MSLLGIFLLSTAAVSGQQPEDLRQDFRDGQLNQEVLKLVGPEAKKFVLREADGLRIRLPAGEGPEGAVGVALRVPVRGDFEITAAFTILQIEPPKAGYGSGVVLQVIKDSDSQELASITRTWRPSEGEAFVANRVSKPGDKPIVKRRDFPADSRSGRLRLVRQGSTLHFLIAEDKQESFREIYQAPFGTEDLRTVRLVVDRGKANSLLEVRLEELTVHTEPLARARFTSWLYWLVMSLVAGLFLAGGVASWWYWHRKPVPVRKAKPATLTA